MQARILPMQHATKIRSIRPRHIPIRVFLLSNHRLLRDALARILQNQSDFLLVGAQESFAAMPSEIIESACEVLLVDPVNIGPLDRQILNQLQNALSNVKIVPIDMEGRIGDVISAIRMVAQGELHFAPETNHGGCS